MAESFLKPERALGMRTVQLWKPFSENLLRTGALLAEKATDVKDEMERTPIDWKVMEGSAISALHPLGDGPAIRAGGGWGHGMQGERDLLGNLYVRNLQILIEKFWKNGQSILLGWENLWKNCSTLQFITFFISGTA